MDYIDKNGQSIDGSLSCDDVHISFLSKHIFPHSKVSDCQLMLTIVFTNYASNPCNIIFESVVHKLSTIITELTSFPFH